VRLRALAPAKVNLSLFLGGLREDGRHRLATVFESLSLADVLALEVLGESGSDVVVCPGVEGENLAARALAALRARGWDGPPVSVSIEKRIPVAAGMAGGSADAAAALRLAMAVAPGRAEEVDAIAAELGADVPSQLVPGLSIGSGAGEIVEHFEPLSDHAYVVVPSTYSLATADVYREADRLGLPRSADDLAAHYQDLVALLSQGVRPRDELIVNDLEPAAVSLCPSITEVLSAVRDAGAEHALVSGSGPTVVGIWWGSDALARASEAADPLVRRYPPTVVAEPVTAEYAAASLI
jgi:4-diphosphocytidyl-2-C-methyl-D-erythritol kinase